MFFDIVYRDQWLLVVNKPAGILSVPAKDLTLTNTFSLVKNHYPQAKIVHRLDEATSGVIIFALDAECEKKLHQQFRDKHVFKQYIAIIEGRLELKIGEINVPIAQDWMNKPKQKICFTTGKPSVTHYKVIRQYSNASRVELTPVTGRTHQLQMHMSYLKHPIIGDKLYTDLSTVTHRLTRRMLLHARVIQFDHPISESLLTIRTPCPF